MSTQLRKPSKRTMSANTKLNKCAKERTPVVEEWSCPVCYTDGSSSGHVIPKCCTHKICLDCYSNILTKTTNCICPVCRAEYLKPAAEQEQEQEQPPAPPQRQEQEEEIWEEDWVDDEPPIESRPAPTPAPVRRHTPVRNSGGDIYSFKMPNWLRNF